MRLSYHSRQTRLSRRRPRQHRMITIPLPRLLQSSPHLRRHQPPPPKCVFVIADLKSATEQAGFEGSDADVKALRGEVKKAEAALKRSKKKDYYIILGIARDCLEPEIKEAYRRESLKHHTDQGGDEESFKLVVEAHTGLSDPQQHERHDMVDNEDGSDDDMGRMGGMKERAVRPSFFPLVFAA